MAYVPPALRKKQHAAAIGSPPQEDIVARKSHTIDLPSLDDVQTHFWPTATVTENKPIENDDRQPSSSTGTSSVFATSEADSVNNAEDNLRTSHKTHSTLNGAEAEPDKLCYVLLFHDAHPRWREDNIIYVKTDLHLLPQDVATPPVDGDSCITSRKEIMVFEQAADFASQIATRARFRFLGFYHLDQMQVLEPKSPELVRMLEQKWTRTNKWGKSRQIQRESQSWQKSLGYRWAVLKFKKIDQAELSPPKIEISQPNGRSNGKENMPTMSLNEMLRGLRLKDQAKVEDKVNDSVNL